MRLTTTLTAILIASGCNHNTAGKEAGSTSGTSSGGSSAETFSIGGTISGLTGAGLVLTDNAGDALAITLGSADFTFAISVLNGASYSVAVATQPADEICTVANGSGAVDAADVTSVAVSCLPVPRFAYIATQGDNTVTAYTINAEGELTQLAENATTSIPGNIDSVAVHPSGKFAYVRSGGGSEKGSVFVYSIDAAGALTLAPATQNAPNPVTIDAGGGDLVIDPAGHFAYVTNGYAGTVAAFSIDVTSGTLTAISGSPYADAMNPVSMAVAPSGKFIYVANQEVGQSFGGYGIASDTGALTPISGFPAHLAAPDAIAIEPAGNFLYTANDNSTLSVYAIDASSGNLTELASSPLTLSAAPLAITADPLGRFMYVTLEGAGTFPDNGPGSVAVYAIDGTGNLTSVGANQVVAHQPDTVAADASGQFVYVLNYFDEPGIVSSFSVTDAGLVPLAHRATMNVGDTPSSIALTGGLAN